MTSRPHAPSIPRVGRTRADANGASPDAPGRTPWHARLLLVRPARVRSTLEVLRRSGLVEQVPNLWQVELGVIRMLHRIAFRPGTIGTAVEAPVRDDPGARLLANRLLRFPFLLREGSIAPWDLSGLASGPDRIERHLLGTHHDRGQSSYDIELLSIHPGRLERLARRARAVVDGSDPHHRSLRNLCVYEGYHERLLESVEARLGGRMPSGPDASDPDVCFAAHLRWCARQPTHPRATWRAWREGRLDLGPASVPA